MRQFVFCVSLLSLLTISCGNENRRNKAIKDFFGNAKQHKTINDSALQSIVVKNVIVDSLPLSQIIDSLYYIHLETTSKSLFGQIDKLQMTKNKIFILDKNESMSILVFDLNGKFLYKINAQGKGPGEYVSLEDFTIDEQRVYALDLSGKKILSYSAENGKFLSEKKMDFFAYEFGKIPEKSSFLFANRSVINPHIPSINLFNALITDTNYIVTDKADKSDFEKNKDFHYSAHNHLSSSSFYTYYHPVLNDTIFKIMPNKMIATINFDFGKMKLPSYFLDHLNDTQFEHLRSTGQYAFMLGDFVVNNDNIYAKIDYGQDYLHLFYSLDSKKAIASRNFPIDQKNILFFGTPIASYGDYFVGYIRFEDAMLQFANSSYYLQKKTTKLKNQFKKFKETDNPILILYKLKNL